MTVRARGIWSETAPPEALGDPSTWRLVARYGLDVALAVRPGGEADLARWTELAREQGVRAAVWPMISDGEGRWLSASNAGIFGDFVREVRASAPGVEVVLDLEPPFPAVRAALDGRRGATRELVALVRDSEERRAGLRAIALLCEEIVASGGGLTLGVVPMVLFDATSTGGWGRLCGAPEGLPATRVNVMLYTSLIEGYSKGLLRREDALSLLASGCAAAASRYGARASASLGAVGVGALGDEPVYVEPASLAEDVAIAEAAGIGDLWLFDLGGVLSRSSPEAWLDAFVPSPEGSTSPAASRLAASRGGAPRVTARARAAGAALRAMGLALGVLAEHGTFRIGF